MFETRTYGANLEVRNLIYTLFFVRPVIFDLLYPEGGCFHFLRLEMEYRSLLRLFLSPVRGHETKSITPKGGSLILGHLQNTLFSVS